MASAQQVLLSPAELAYLHSTLSLTPPIRPDGRKANQFRPLTAETGILPGTNGSARVCFSDGTEAIVGVKAEIEKTPKPPGSDEDIEETKKARQDGEEARGRNEWLEITVEIPGSRDDDAATIFLANMLSEALLADGEFSKKLRINSRFHWKLYLDVRITVLRFSQDSANSDASQILLISPPLSYPLPLLSLTTHIALLATRLPRLKSEGDEDPMFDDDWEASTYLYPREGNVSTSRPPITLLVIAVGNNIIFDPAREELAVAESALAVSVAEERRAGHTGAGDMDVDGSGRELKLLAVRTVDPPSRLTAPGVPNSANPATGLAGTPSKQPPTPPPTDGQPAEGVWKPPIGGAKLNVLEDMIAKVLEKGGIADEVLDGIAGVDLS
ncbi:3 exoribonuclease family protein [Colletotrichum truncatum]|uniref:3 exoribonuclease family protein n=1 Tax=Colletotrichum truncatum TaxID=5467 RepID=A0ACC3Z9J0_COLTU|nr:3 exoribonuclease family protein [Colletotrichum truncatum]KAF6793638.1 3 exoribonuclease family protein [Colletotrichum truncatum]